MDYNAPSGSTDPNASYVGKNTVAGIQGSKIPPKAVEMPQREIVNLEIEAGLTPTNADPKQLLRAIRSGKLSYLIDVGTASALVALPNTSHTAYVPGAPFCIQLANNVTGATTLNISNLGAIPVTFPGGGPLRRYDYLAGDLLYGRINTSGTAFIALSPVNQPTIDKIVSKSVYGAGADFPDLPSAFAWVSARRISASGQVTFMIAAGVGAQRYTSATDILFNHPDAARIQLSGQALASSVPGPYALAGNGSSQSQRATDTATNLSTLRAIFTSELSFTGGSKLRILGGIGAINNLLVTADGAGVNIDGVVFQGGVSTINNFIMAGANYRGILTIGGTLNIGGTCYSLGSGNTGVSAEQGGVIYLAPASILTGLSNGGAGILASSGQISCSPTASLIGRCNGSDGVSAQFGGTVVANANASAAGNAVNGFSALFQSTGLFNGAVVSGNNVGFACGNGSFMDAGGTSGASTTTAYSAFGAGRSAGAAVRLQRRHSTAPR